MSTTATEGFLKRSLKKIQVLSFSVPLVPLHIYGDLRPNYLLLYKNANNLSLHYVAGIGTGTLGVGGSFIFYNTGYSDIDGKAMSIWKFLEIIKSKGNTPIFFIGVYGKKGWW